MKEIWEKYKKQFKEAWKQLKTPGERRKQIPNILTSSRLLAPFVIIPSVAMGNFPLAGISTLIFSATDLVDGFIARKLNITSELGKDLDAFSDKIFVGTLMISLLFTNPMYFIPFLLEGTIAGININKKIKNENPESHMIGKVKMTSLYFLIATGFINMYISVPSLLTNLLYASTIGLQALTICDYAKPTKEDKTASVDKKEIMDEEILSNEKELSKEELEKKKTLRERHLEEYRDFRKILEQQIELQNCRDLENSEQELSRSYQLKKQKNDKK